MNYFYCDACHYCFSADTCPTAALIAVLQNIMMFLQPGRQAKMK